MKKIVFVSVIALLAVGVFFLRTPEEHFGEVFRGFKMVPLRDAIAPDAQLQEQNIRRSGVITRQCPSSGCWFFIKDDSNNQIKVELGHLGMKFPMRSGHIVEVEGRLLQKSDGWQLIGNGVTFGAKK